MARREGAIQNPKSKIQNRSSSMAQEILFGNVSLAAIVIGKGFRERETIRNALALLPMRIDDLAVDKHLLDRIAGIEEAALLNHQVRVLADFQTSDTVRDADG